MVDPRSGLIADVPLRTSLRWSASTHKVNCGSASVIDDLQEMTSLSWVWVESFASDARIWQKAYIAAHGTAHNIYMEAATQRVECSYSRATTSQSVYADVSSFAAWGLDKWMCIVTRSHATIDASNAFEVGDLWRPPAGPSAYVRQTAGSGAFVSDAAASLYLGNKENDNANLAGRIALVAWYNRRLTDVEVLAAWQGFYFHPGLVGLWQPSHMGAETVLDLSGYTNHGTVTGAGLSFGLLLPDEWETDIVKSAAALSGNPWYAYAQMRS